MGELICENIEDYEERFLILVLNNATLQISYNEANLSYLIKNISLDAHFNIKNRTYEHKIFKVIE